DNASGASIDATSGNQPIMSSAEQCSLPPRRRPRGRNRLCDTFARGSRFAQQASHLERWNVLQILLSDDSPSLLARIERFDEDERCFRRRTQKIPPEPRTPSTAPDGSGT